MAKKKTVALNPIVAMLTLIASGENGVGYVTQAEAATVTAPAFNPPLIEVNTALMSADGTKAAARLTEAGVAYLAANAAPVVNGSEAAHTASQFAIITDAVLPEVKRGNKGGGAPAKYPFDQLQPGQSFFVGVSADLPNPVKTLGSTVSNANQKYAVETGETKKVIRTKRGPGNKAVVDATGAKVKEEVTVPVTKAERKFSIRAVKAGVAYGAWTAPSDGALIARVA